MNVIVNKEKRNATVFLNLADELDRLTFIAWMQQLKPTNAVDQFQIDQCILAAQGEPEHFFPGYENMTQ